MNKKVIYFLMNQVILIMDYKKIFSVLIIFFYSSSSVSEVLYKKENLIITSIDVNTYQELYKNNYGSLVDNNNAIKDLVLINNLINYFEEYNKDFINRIDSEILNQYGDKYLDDYNYRNFIRFSKIRDEFIINYFNNNLEIKEIEKIFNELDNLTLPISINECLIIEKTVDLRNNQDFIKNLLHNLKNNLKDFKIKIDNIDYKVCIDESNLRFLEQLIVKYIESQTNDEFKYFVYGKTKN